MNLFTLANDHLDCAINFLGAELSSLKRRDGHEYMWDGDPAYWSGRAPILFPIVGALAGGAYRWEGREVRLEKHGFARRRMFALVERDDDSATLRLVSDAGTRAIYPFEFELDMGFSLTTALTVNATVRNRGDGPMPFSFGFHPALRWPLDGPASLSFDKPESGPVWRIDADGLVARHEPLAGDGRSLLLEEGLFADDAMILLGTASRGVRFEHAEGSVRMEWSNLPDLALWKKPGAAFLCIEPWAGHSDPAGFSGDLSDKPGIVLLAPGTAWSASMTIEPA